MNTSSYGKTSKKWIWKSPNAETKNEIDFILINKLNTVENVQMSTKEEQTAPVLLDLTRLSVQLQYYYDI